MLWLLLILLLPSTVRAAEYYAATTGGGNTCSIGSPCTIPGGIAKMTGGDTLHIRGGDYSNLEFGNAIPSGTAGTRTIITGYQGEVVNLLRSKITMDGSVSNQYITLKNFNIDCQTTDCWIRVVDPVNNILFDRVNIGNSTTSSTGAGMVTGNASFIEFRNMHIYNAGAGNCSFYANQGCYGTYLNGHHLTFDNVDVYDNGGIGLQVYHSGAFDVHDCVVKNSRFYNNGYNDARGYAGNGLLMASGDNNVAYNNVAWGNNAAGISVNYGCNNCAVYNNTSVSNGNTGNGYGIEINQSTGVKVYNNIVYNNGNGSFSQQIVDWNGNSDLQNNLQAVNPNFTNPGAHDYSILPGSPAQDAGRVVSIVTTDIVGTTRPQPTGGNYDIGAYEITQGGSSALVYVDKNNLGGTCNNNNSGAINFPVCTIQAGIGKLSAGSTLFIRGGTYNETINPAAYTLPTGTAANPITISGYQSEVVTITNGIIIQDNVNSSIVAYLIFDHLTVRNNGDPAFRIAGNSHHIKMMNSDLQTFATSQTQQNAPNIVQIAQTAWYNEVINCDVHDAPVAFDLGVTLGHYGFYVGGQNNIYDGNRIYNNTGYGINLFQSGSSQVSNNIIRNNTLYNNCFDDGNRGNGANAVIIGSGSNNLMYNNVIYNNNCTGTGAAVSVGYTNGGTGNAVYNNTIYNNNGPGIAVDATAPGTIVQNNIVYNNNGSPSNTQIANASSGSTMTPNLTTNPNFENAAAANFKLMANSPAIDIGVTLAAVPTDKDGVVRPQPPGGSYDMGAYEFLQSGPIPTTGNPIYVAKTGSASNTCTAAESQSTPKLTIGDALQCMTVPGKVMYIKAGTYVEEIDTVTNPITGGNGPSYSDATRIEGFGSDVVVIASPVATSGITVFIHNSTDKFLIFKKLTIDAASHAGNALIIYGPAHHIRFDTVTIKNALPNENALIYAANNIEMLDTTVTGAGTNGIGLAGAIDTFLCMRCRIMLNGARGVDVRNGGAKTNISIMRTDIDSNATDGIDSVGTTNMVVQNSIVRSNSGNGIRIQGSMVSTKLFNNTVYGNTGNGVQCNSGATGTEMTNVLSYGNGTNLVNNCVGQITLLTNLTGTVDPLFVSAPSDLRLANGSPGIDQGTNLPALTTDYAGLARQQGQQDIGAHERALGTPPIPPGPGVLAVSTTNPRYMVNPAGDIVYLTGAYSWNFADTMPDQEFADYLAYVVAHGYNLLRVPSQDYNGEAQITSYFDVLASRIGQAATAGLYVQVSILPFTEAPFDNAVFNEAYARDLVRAVGAYPNVIYEVGNELDTQALDGGTIGAFSNAMVDVINNEQSVQGFTPRRMVGISDFKADNTYNVSPATVSFLLGSHADFVAIGFSQRTFTPCWVNPDYAGAKVSIPDTDHISPYQCDHKWAWKIFTMGGNPTLLDGNAFTADHSVPDDPSDTFGAAATYDARSRMGDTRTYAVKMRLDMAIPHPELSTTGYALAWPGNQYLVYQPATGSFNVTLAAGDYTVEWFNPTEHTTTTTTLTASAGAHSFSTPLNPAHDAVLLLKVGTPMPPAPDVTVLAPSKRGRSMLFDLAPQACWHNGFAVASQQARWHNLCNILP